MGDIELIKVSSAYADGIWGFRKEIIGCDAGNEDQFAGCSGLGGSESSEAWAKICRLGGSEEARHEAGARVSSHTCMIVCKEDNKAVGIIDSCHRINHPILGSWDRHYGYSVCPSERGRGYAKEVLRLNRRNVKALGITGFLVIYGEKNIASKKTVISNGGVYEQVIEAGRTKMKRY